MAGYSTSQVSDQLSKMKYQLVQDVKVEEGGTVVAEMEVKLEDSNLEVPGFASVYRANELGTNQVIAVKVYHHKQNSDEYNRQLRVRIKIETKLYAFVRGGPHIIVTGEARNFNTLKRHIELPMAFYAYRLSDFMAMSPGVSGLVDGLLVVPDFYNTVLIQMVKAVEFLHSKNIIQRDIRPRFIHCNDKEHFVLADFSSAARGGPPRRDFCGSWAYMCPEMVNVEIQTSAVDLWNLGLLSLDMLGVLPPEPPARDLAGMQTSGWNNRLVAIADAMEKPEVSMMVQIDPSMRPSASQLRSFLEASPSTQVRKLLPSDQFMFLVLSERLRPVSPMYVWASVHEYHRKWAQVRQEFSENQQNQPPVSSGEISSVAEGPPSASQGTEGPSSAAPEELGASSIEGAMGSQSKSRKKKKKKRKSSGAAAGPSTESQETGASSSLAATPPIEPQDTGGPSSSAATPPIEPQDTGRPSSSAATSPTESQKIQKKRKPSSGAAESSTEPQETGISSGVAVGSSTGTPRKEGTPSAIVPPPAESQEVRESSNAATTMSRTKSEEVEGPLRSAAVPLRTNPRELGESSSAAGAPLRSNLQEMTGPLGAAVDPLRIKSQEMTVSSHAAGNPLRTKSQEIDGSPLTFPNPMRTKSQGMGESSGMTAKTPPVGLQMIPSIAGSTNASVTLQSSESQRQGGRPTPGAKPLPTVFRRGDFPRRVATEFQRGREPSSAAASQKPSNESPRERESPSAGASEKQSSESPRKEKSSIWTRKGNKQSSATATPLSGRPQGEGEPSITTERETPSSLAATPPPAASQESERLPSAAGKKTSLGTMLPLLTRSQRTEGLASTSAADRPSSSAATLAPAAVRGQEESSRAAVKEKSSDKATTSTPFASQRNNKASGVSARGESSSAGRTSAATRSEVKESSSSEGISEKLLRLPEMRRPTSSQSIARSSSSISMPRPTSSRGSVGSPSSTTMPRSTTSQGMTTSPRSTSSQEIAGPSRVFPKSNLGRDSSKNEQQRSIGQGEAKAPQVARSAQPQPSVVSTAFSSSDGVRPTESVRSTSSSTGTSTTAASRQPVERSTTLSSALSVDAPEWDGKANRWAKPESERPRRPEARRQQQLAEARRAVPQQLPLSQEAQGQQLGPQNRPVALVPPSFPQGQMNMQAQTSPPTQFFPQNQGYLQLPNYPQLPPYLQAHGYPQAQGYPHVQDYPQGQPRLSPGMPPPHWVAYAHQKLNQGFRVTQGRNSAQQYQAQRPSPPRPQNQRSRAPARQASATPAEVRGQRAEAQVRQRSPPASAPPASAPPPSASPPSAPPPSAPPPSSLPEAQSQPGETKSTQSATLSAKSQVRMEGIGHGRVPSRNAAAPGSLEDSQVSHPPPLAEHLARAMALARDEDRFVSPSPSPPPHRRVETQRVEARGGQPAPPVQRAQSQAGQLPTRPAETPRQRAGAEAGNRSQSGLSQLATRPAEDRNQSQPSQASSTTQSTPERPEGQAQGQSRGTYAKATTKTRTTDRQNQPGGSGPSSQPRADAPAAARGPSPPRGAAAPSQGQPQPQQQQQQEAEQPWQLSKGALKRQRSRAKMGSNKSLVSHQLSEDLK